MKGAISMTMAVILGVLVAGVVVFLFVKIHPVSLGKQLAQNVLLVGS